MKHTKKRTERQRKKWALIGLAFFLVATVLICWQVGLPMVRLASDPENFRQWLEERKLGGLLIYGAMVFFQVLFAVIPGEPLEIAGGYAFGAVWGTLVCLVAATLGSLLVFGPLISTFLKVTFLQLPTNCPKKLGNLPCVHFRLLIV